MSLPTTGALAAAVAIVVACYIGFEMVTYEQPPILQSFVDEQQIAMQKAKVVRGDDGGLRVVAGALVRRGDVVMTIPATRVITAEGIFNSTTYGKALSVEKGQHITAALLRGGVDSSFMNAFLYTFYFAMEKRNPQSTLQRLFAELPLFTEADGALHWPEAAADCLDSQASGETKVLRHGLAACVIAAQAVCEADVSVCANGGPPTLDELRWGMTVYLKYNYQDQAVIPMMMLARFNNSFHGLSVTFSAERGVLEIIANADTKKGEELFLSYPRGPSIQLVSRGWFDPASLGVDVSIDIKSIQKTKLGKKYCVDKYHELMWGVDGKPREALISCVALVLASDEERRVFGEHRRNAALMKTVYGSLRGHLVSALKDFDAESDESCVISQSLRKTFDDYSNFVGSVLRRNLQYVKNMEEKLQS